MLASAKFDAGCMFLVAVCSPEVDDLLAVNLQAGAIIRAQIKNIVAILGGRDFTTPPGDEIILQLDTIEALAGIRKVDLSINPDQPRFLGFRDGRRRAKAFT